MNLSKLKLVLLGSAFLVGTVIGLSLFVAARDVHQAWAATQAITDGTEMKGGGTAVLLPDGRIFNLTNSGWRAAVSSPIPAKDVAIVLHAYALVGKDGTGWVLGPGNEWRAYKLPGK